MGKCFLWLWGGILFGLSYFVSDIVRHGEHWTNAIPGMLEWVLLGGALTVAAVFGYALYTVYEGRAGASRPTHNE